MNIICRRTVDAVALVATVSWFVCMPVLDGGSVAEGNLAFYACECKAGHAFEPHDLRCGGE